MAAARLLIGRNAAPVAAGLAAATLAFCPRPAYAEGPDSTPTQQRTRKPIYSDPIRPAPPVEATNSPKAALADSSRPIPTTAPAGTTALPASFELPTREPTPTDLLAGYVRQARHALYDASGRVEDEVNGVAARAFDLEHSLTSTVRSLAPPPGVDEPLLPGATYMLVAALSGSILTRSRGILLRFSVPLAFGLAAGQVVLPYTMRNVGDLAWTYERRYPQLADAHLQARERVERFWETGKGHLAMSQGMLEEKIDEARRGIQGWVSKGK